MAAKNQKLISALLIISIIVPTVLFSKPKKTEAVWWSSWVTDVNTGFTKVDAYLTRVQQTIDTKISLKNLAKEVLRQALKNLAKRAVQQMTKSTVNWINSGFHGAPLFLENPQSFFKDIGKYEVKTFINQIGYNSLKYPFGKNFSLNTIGAYKRKFEDNAQYSLSKVIYDPLLLDRYRNDFYVGGWNGFLINTQYPQNNYIGFQLLATDELAGRLQGISQNNAQRVNTTLAQGMGFLSPQTCPSNPKYNNLANQFQQPSFKTTIPYTWVYDESKSPEENEQEKIIYDESYERKVANERSVWQMTNTCPDGLVSTTPGSVVGSFATNALNSGQRQGELAIAMGDSISAIVDALLNKFIGSGLNALASKSNPKPPPDNWSYYGETLGVAPYNSTSWANGPDVEIVLSSFKKTVEDDITNTTTEIELMDNISAVDSSGALDIKKAGIMQMLGAIWPKARELDMCLPGPDLNWQDRMDKEMERNSGLLSEKLNDEDQEKAAQAQLAVRELQFAVDFFKDWIINKMLIELPNSVIYMDAIEEIKTLATQADALIDARRIKAQALARLQSIKISLATLTTQPAPDSGGEKVLISIKKQYDATIYDVSNPTTIENTRNDLAVAKDKFANLGKLITQCTTERISIGGSVPGVVTTTGGGSGGNFCPENLKTNQIMRGAVTTSKSSLSLSGCLSFCKSQNANACNYGVDPGNTSLTYCEAISGGDLHVQSPYNNWSYVLPQTAACRAPSASGSEWANADPNGANRPYKGARQNEEQGYFCDTPIWQGYSHGSFKAYDWENGKNGSMIPPLPMVNARNVLSFSTFWSFLTGPKNVDINLNCDIIFNSNPLDYKGKIPGMTTVTQPYVEITLPPSGGGGGDTGGGGGGTPPASLLSDVQAERSKYGAAVLSEEQRGWIVNAVAWKNRDAGWGLSHKDFGNFCNTAAGPVACDVLVHKPSNTWVDVLTDTSAQWLILAPNNDPRRFWVPPGQP